MQSYIMLVEEVTIYKHCQTGALLSHFFLSFFLSWASKTQPNHWTKDDKHLAFFLISHLGPTGKNLSFFLPWVSSGDRWVEENQKLFPTGVNSSWESIFQMNVDFPFIA
jgi:hypothetical protein